MKRLAIAFLLTLLSAAAAHATVYDYRVIDDDASLIVYGPPDRIRPLSGGQWAVSVDDTTGRPWLALDVRYGDVGFDVGVWLHDVLDYSVNFWRPETGEWSMETDIPATVSIVNASDIVPAVHPGLMRTLLENGQLMLSGEIAGHGLEFNFSVPCEVQPVPEPAVVLLLPVAFLWRRMSCV